jgi:predicted phage tail protein
MPSNNGGAAITNYTVYRGTTSDGETLLITLGNVLTFTNEGLTNGQIYYYKVSAMNSVGEGANSTSVNAMPSAETTLPSAPQNLTAVSGNNFVVLTWDTPVNIGNPSFTCYEIFRGVSAGSVSTTPIGQVVVGTLTYNDTTAVNGDIYVYVVKAINTLGASSASNTVQGSPVALGSAPGAPTLLTATNQHGCINISWTPAAGGGASNYLIFRGTTAGDEGSTPIATVLVGTSYEDKEVIVGTTYHYMVKANNSYGISPFSNEANGTAIANDTPSCPQGLFVTNGSGQVTLTWQSPTDDGGADILSYQIYRSTGGGAETQIAQVNGNVLTYVDTSVTAGTSYTYCVKAVNEIGTGATSTPQTATAVIGGGGTSDNTLMYAGIGIGVIIVAILTILMLMRRKK